MRLLKTKVVLNDEFESGERKMLNFGHTLGHAIENLYQIPHGHAISIGMGVAAVYLRKINGFKETARVYQPLKEYGLPPNLTLIRRKHWKYCKRIKRKQAKKSLIFF